MAGPVFGKARPSEEGGPRVTHLDRDRSLVDAARRDPAEFDALYRRYLAQVYSYAYYELGDHHEAEDVTERTFLAALANLDRFEERARPADGDGASTFRVWLFRIARNVVANQRRTQRRRPVAPIEAAAHVARATASSTGTPGTHEWLQQRQQHTAEQTCSIHVSGTLPRFGCQ